MSPMQFQGRANQCHADADSRTPSQIPLTAMTNLMKAADLGRKQRKTSAEPNAMHPQNSITATELDSKENHALTSKGTFALNWKLFIDHVAQRSSNSQFTSFLAPELVHWLRNQIREEYIQARAFLLVTNDTQIFV